MAMVAETGAVVSIAHLHALPGVHSESRLTTTLPLCKLASMGRSARQGASTILATMAASWAGASVHVQLQSLAKLECRQCSSMRGSSRGSMA